MSEMSNSQKSISYLGYQISYTETHFLYKLPAKILCAVPLPSAFHVTRFTIKTKNREKMWRKKICMDDSGRFPYKTNDRNFSLLSVCCGIFFATKRAVVPRCWFCYGAMPLLCRWQKRLSKLESARTRGKKKRTKCQGLQVKPRFSIIIDNV